MRTDLYTKAVLTVTALLLAVIAFKPLFQPPPALAQGSFAGVQVTHSGSTTQFFDSRTGDVWRYDGNFHVRDHFKLTKLGTDLVQ